MRTIGAIGTGQEIEQKQDKNMKLGVRLGWCEKIIAKQILQEVPRQVKG